VFGLGCLREYHRRPGTTLFGLVHYRSSPPRGLPNSASWTEGVFLRDFSLNDAAASNHVVPAWAQFLLFGRETSGADLIARNREEMPSFWPRSPCARFAAAAFASFQLLRPR
jgi:hypothetical protein